MNIATKVWGALSSRPAAAIAGALTVLLLAGGTATAAATIGNEDIKNGAVSKEKIRKDSAGTWEVKDRTLGGWDLRKDSVGRHVFTPHIRDMLIAWENGEFSEPGPQGPQGEPGADGADGTDGKDGVSGYEVIAVEQRLPVGSHTVVASCPGDKVAVGGGYELSADGANGANSSVQQSQTTDLAEQADGTWQGTSWTVRATIGEGAAQGMGNVKAVVNCAAVN